MARFHSWRDVLWVVGAFAVAVLLPLILVLLPLQSRSYESTTNATQLRVPAMQHVPPAGTKVTLEVNRLHRVVR